MFGLLLSNCTEETINQTYTVNELVYEIDDIECEIFNNINQKRIDNNIHPLVLDKLTQEISGKRVNEMIQDSVVSHQMFGTYVFKLLSLGAEHVGENVAYGYGTSAGVSNAWFDSEGHLKNILNPKYDWCGISVMEDPITKRKYFCHFFGGDDNLN